MKYTIIATKNNETINKDITVTDTAELISYLNTLWDDGYEIQEVKKQG